MIPFELIRDDSASVMDHLHFDDEEHFYAHVHELGRNFTLNKLAAQRIEIRVYCEAAGMMPQLHAALEPYSVPVYSCSGFDSLTFKHQLARWFSETYAWRGKVPVMLHLGDYYPDGESIFDVIREDAVAFLGRAAQRDQLPHEELEGIENVPTRGAAARHSQAPRGWHGGRLPGRGHSRSGPKRRSDGPP